MRRVIVDKPVNVVTLKKRKKRNRNSSLRESEQRDEDDPNKTYSSVVCDICETEVGARDNEEVYHFFHVLATNA